MVDSVKRYNTSGVNSTIELGKSGSKIVGNVEQVSLLTANSDLISANIDLATELTDAIQYSQLDEFPGRVKKLSKEFSYDDGLEGLATFLANTTVLKIAVEATTVWENSTSSTDLTVGDLDDLDRLINNFDPDIQSVEAVDYTYTSNTDVFVNIVPGGATAGNAKVHVWYSGLAEDLRIVTATGFYERWNGSSSSTGVIETFDDVSYDTNAVSDSVWLNGGVLTTVADVVDMANTANYETGANISSDISWMSNVTAITVADVVDMANTANYETSGDPDSANANLWTYTGNLTSATLPISSNAVYTTEADYANVVSSNANLWTYTGNLTSATLPISSNAVYTTEADYANVTTSNANLWTYTGNLTSATLPISSNAVYTVEGNSNIDQTYNVDSWSGNVSIANIATPDSGNLAT